MGRQLASISRCKIGDRILYLLDRLLIAVVNVKTVRGQRAIDFTSRIMRVKADWGIWEFTLRKRRIKGCGAGCER